MFYIVDLDGRSLGLPAYINRNEAVAVAELLGGRVITR